MPKAARFFILVLFLFASAALGGLCQTAAAAESDGSITGKVTSDKGDVHAVRVKAKDTVRKISYTVFTKNGRYQIFNLPAGSYQVFAMQDGFKSTTQETQLASGETKT